jgi:hypothetical protein
MVDQEVEKLLKMKVIEYSTHVKGGYFTNIFGSKT